MIARACFTLAGLALALGAAACTGTTTLPSGPSMANPLDAEENAIVASLNQRRQAQSMATVTVCMSLNVSASAHADDMSAHVHDKNHLSDVGSDGSSVQARACTAGYTAACGAAALPMAEVVASGSATGDATFQQWLGDMTSQSILDNGALIVVGVGSAEADDGTMLWALDLGGVADPSCP